ncbi:hypothetical protein Pint_18155 [Pistacia integerrima]|uniref:Uncharacterized protein n=1 Tax=Pistacia integerrima TaxID=434235 RepID=A0ACC0YWK5_9ROSI|nr:hypothetical protein Pint_18155 [Pistacia integerrima]
MIFDQQHQATDMELVINMQRREKMLNSVIRAYQFW